MTREEAFDFLRTHQPLPAELDAELHRQLRETWEYFAAHPEAEAIPLWLNVFGGGDAGGIFQRVEDLLEPFPAAEVVPHLKHAMQEGNREARYWAAQFAALFPDETLVEPLAELLRRGDSDVRAAAATALVQIQSNDVAVLRKEAAMKETDPEVRALLLGK
jgi:hypothetical protein